MIQLCTILAEMFPSVMQKLFKIVISDQISIIIDLFHLKHGFYAYWRIIQN